MKSRHYIPWKDAWILGCVRPGCQNSIEVSGLDVSFKSAFGSEVFQGICQPCQVELEAAYRALPCGSCSIDEHESCFGPQCPCVDCRGLLP